MNLDHELAVLIFSPAILWKHTLRDYECAPDLWHCSGFISHSISIFLVSCFLSFRRRHFSILERVLQANSSFIFFFFGRLWKLKPPVSILCFDCLKLMLTPSHFELAPVSCFDVSRRADEPALEDVFTCEVKINLECAWLIALEVISLAWCFISFCPVVFHSACVSLFVDHSITQWRQTATKKIIFYHFFYPS